MITKQVLISCIVGFKETNSFQVLDEPGFLNEEMCHKGDIPLVRRIAAITSELFDAFDYSKSPEFVRSLEGKSEAFRAMKLKLITPQRRTEMRKRLGDALARVIDSDEVLELIEPGRWERIKELRNLLTEVSNPDQRES